MSKLTVFILLLAGLLWVSCGEDDYHYPSVRQEYLTVSTDAAGALQAVVTDEGQEWPVVDDRTSTSAKADTTYRIVSNYELVSDADVVKGVRLYAVLSAIAPVPVTADYFEDGVRTDVCRDLLSCWPGYGYLNAIVLVRQQGKHAFHFVEDSVETCTDGLRTVHLTLYHEAETDVQDYEKRVYLSIPLQQYFSSGDVRRLKICFGVHTDAGLLLKEVLVNKFASTV